ncbi:BlaI/MecI/CopY family transcriptional regulator [Streptomyces sp. NPDC003691]
MWNLGSLEAEVMDRIWSAAEPVTVREVSGEINSARAQPLAYTTVMTTMYKLFRKGWLTRDKRGKQYVYAPVEARDACVARLMNQVLGDSADPDVALLHFVQGLGSERSTALRSALHRLPGDPVAGAAPESGPGAAEPRDGRDGRDGHRHDCDRDT